MPVNIITKNHKLLYERIREYLLDEYGIVTDHTSDIPRPCYLPHDDDAFYDEPTFRANPASKLLASLVSTDNSRQTTDNKLHKTETNQKTVDCSQNLNPDGDCRPSTVDFRQNNYENDIEKIVREIEHRRIDITNNYHDWMLVAMALAGTCGATGEHYFHRISQFHPKYDNAEAHRMYQSCVRNTHGAVGIGTIVYLMNR